MIKLFKIEIDSNRIFGLDILRAFAILFVIHMHAANYVPASVKSIYTIFSLDGVSIFFVLSGFLIGKILIQLCNATKFDSKTLGALDLKPINGLYSCVFSFSVFALAILFLIPFLSSIESGKSKIYSAISHIILISYSMYILHLSIIQFWIIDNINWSYIDMEYNLVSCIKYVLFLILTFILSTLLYKYFELPLMNLRGKKNKEINP